MSRIFAVVSLATATLVAVAAFASASQSTETTSDSFDPIVNIFATQLELTMFIPLALAAGMLLAAVGVLAR